MVLALLLACAALEPCTPILRYADEDGDGFGDPDEPVAVCAPSALPQEADATDCDDADPDVSPAKEETCNGVDDDCDGEVDDDIGPTWYYDNDGDGFGGESVVACEQPEDAIVYGGDCYDDNEEMHPAAHEDCSTRRDDDCDGETNSPEAYGCRWFYRDGDGDGFADPAGERECLCEANEDFPDSELGDCDDTDPEIYPGALERWDHVDQDCDGVLAIGRYPAGGAALIGVWGEDEDDRAGCSIATGDMTGDGSPDLLVGASRADGPTGPDVGAAYIVAGPPPGMWSLGSETTTQLSGAEFDDGAGLDVASGGDVDGDGIDDALVGARLAGGASTPGEVYLVFGGALPAAMNLADADAVWTGGTGDTAGRGLAFAGDLDGDGRSDVLVGAAGRSTSAPRAGGAYLLFDAGSGGALPDASVVFVAEHAEDAAGEEVVGPGDLDGDGFDDLLIGAAGLDAGADDAGGAYLIFGPVAGGEVPLASADARILGADPRTYVGGALAAGDANGDGLGDILIGTKEHVAERHAVYLLLGPFTGTRSVAAAAAVFEGTAEEGRAADLAFIGDQDGDGGEDFAVGSPFMDDGWFRASGAVHVFGGGATGAVATSDAFAAFKGTDDAASLGVYVGPAGDFNGDGISDLLIGAPGETRSGRAYVVTAP